MKKILMFACLMALCNLTLLAQTEKGPRIVHTKEKSAIHVPPQEVPASLKTIYTNLGKKTDLYDDTYGWAVVGPAAEPNGEVQFPALPFTPKANSTVSQVRVAVQWYDGGANQVNLSIYGDTNGIPGALLAGPVTVSNLSSSGCCALAVANFSPVAVTAGTRYWVVANTPSTGTGSDSFDVWYITAKRVPMALFSGSPQIGYGWSEENANRLLAGQVLGTIP